MIAVNWRKWMEDPTVHHSANKINKGDLVWEDDVTGTIFSISEKDYDRLISKLNERLQTASLPNLEKEWEVRHLPFGFNSEDELVYHLPFPKPSKDSPLKRTRLVDHVMVRTGLYFAIHKPDEDEWPEVKRSLLQIESPLAKDIDHYIVHQEWNGVDIEIDVVKAGAVKIGQYFLETNNIQEVRGASVLLDDINMVRIYNLCKKYWTKESLIYSGGGNMLIVLPKGEGEKCCEFISDMFKKITITAQFVAHYETFQLSDLNKSNFNNSFSWLEMKKSEKQYMMLPPIEEDDIPANINAYDGKMEIDKLMKVNSIANSTKKDDDFHITGNLNYVCELCNQRTAKQNISYKAEDKNVCQTCLHKVIAGRNKSIHLTELVDFIKDKSMLSKMKADSETLEDIVQGLKNDYIACVYGDGNNMGKIVEEMASLTSYRYFSHLTDSATKFSLYNALSEVMGDDIVGERGNARFEVLAVGGDDVFILVPGEYSLAITRKFGEKFDQAFSKIREKTEETITISAGVCIGNYKLPFIRLAKIAMELMASAKKVKKTKNINGGTIDYMKIQTSTPYAGGLNEYRQLHLEEKVNRGNEVQYIYKYFRPLNWAQMEDLENWLSELKEIQTSRGIVYKLKEISDSMTINEASLFYLYFMSSNRGSSSTIHHRNAFQKLLRRRNEKPLLKERNLITKDLFFVGKEDERGNDLKETHIYSPWGDLLELWDVEG